MAVILKCPECEGKFRHQFSDEQRWPKHCPICDAGIGTDVPDDVITIPAFISARTQSIEKVARQIQDGSEVRALAAAEMAGVPVSEMANLKITNMQDGRHEGDVQAPKLPEHLQNVGGWQNVGVEAFSGAVASGPHPRMGSSVATRLTTAHNSGR